MSKKATIVHCPTCQNPVQWDETMPYRPFCSKRCQLIDLGDWATEQNSIAGEQSGMQTTDHNDDHD